MSRHSRPIILLVAVGALLASCGTNDNAAVGSATESEPPPTTMRAAAEGCADVIAVAIDPGETGFTVSATVESADTGWEKYADLWEVRAPDGSILGERVLAHPHETEQPFTRSVSGVAIPLDITEVVVAARDSVAGFCGAEFTAEVPHP